MKTILRIARKELATFFATPVAFLFFGTFLVATLFIFFWVDTFFARNIAEVRPLFDWMPILLIFLSAALTMRSWAEERRAGTLEFLLTSPVRPLSVVLGKFLACLVLVGIALLLTLPLPITVSFIGPLDWGPVAAGYLATFFLAAAYLAIGLFISVRSENQIISLIGAVLACGLFYLPGSETLTSLVGNKGAEILRLLGSGSRFESISRGIIDLRDLFFYVSVAAIFLSLNVYGLERLRWAGNRTNSNHKAWNLLIILLITNLAAANIWLHRVDTLRFDATRDKIYSISQATRHYLAQLQEPLLIRGYFSAQTHPLLAPLAPRLRDLLKEYEIAGKGKVRVEVIDPAEHPELEQEAGQKYGIRPVPFETSSKYQASVTNSYFDILIKYGDQFETLGFRDLIEVKARGERDLDVELRNPEYDLTRSVKKVLYAYQGAGNLFDNIKGDVAITGYISADNKLPEELAALKAELVAIGDRLRQQAGDRIKINLIDPDADGGKVAQTISSKYGFRPMATSLLNPQTFWFYITLENNNRVVQVPLPQGLSAEELDRSIKGALKRFSRGFLKTIALHTPPSTPPMPQFGMMQPQGKQFRVLRETLGEEYAVVDADLKNGHVPEEADLLMVLSPDKLDEKQLFAVDQFLMQGGTVALATAPFDVTLQGKLAATKHESGMEKWLAAKGITLEHSMILDAQNSPFPVPVERQVGMFRVRETKLINYPYFIDIRKDGMAPDQTMLSGINQLTMNWAVPITVDSRANSKRTVTRLLHSSARSWLSDSLNIQPDFARFGTDGFQQGDDLAPRLVGVMVKGAFTSWFTDKPSPLLAEEKNKNSKDTTEKSGDTTTEEEQQLVVSRIIDHSPESARLVLFSSNTFLTDTSLAIISSVLKTAYDAPVQLMNNVADWSLEDRDLLAIRGRGQFARTLLPLTQQSRVFWEYLNYGLALGGLALIWLVRVIAAGRSRRKYQQILTTGRAQA